MEIRRSHVSDAAAIAELELNIFSHPFTERDIANYISSENGMCFTALENGEVIAYVVGNKIFSDGEIYRFAVREDKRKCGIGLELLRFAMRAEKECGITEVFLEVREQNAAARALYLSYGFEEIGRRENYYLDPKDNAILMAIRL